MSITNFKAVCTLQSSLESKGSEDYTATTALATCKMIEINYSHEFHTICDSENIAVAS